MKDIDECLESLDNCDMDLANCTNTIGSFNCTCIDGFTGDGVNCTSKIEFVPNCKYPQCNNHNDNRC